MLKINAYIMNHKPGDVIREGDKNYDVFKNWADRKDKRSGLIIAEYVNYPALKGGACVVRHNEKVAISSRVD